MKELSAYSICENSKQQQKMQWVKVEYAAEVYGWNLLIEERLSHTQRTQAEGLDFLVTLTVSGHLEMSKMHKI